HEGIRPAGELRAQGGDRGVTHRALPVGLLGLGAAVLLWALGTHLLKESGAGAALPRPRETFPPIYQLLAGSELRLHTLMRLRRVLVGLALALAAGIPIGLAVGVSRPVESATGGAFQFLRMISPLSWMPIAVMVLGIGDAPIYFLLAFAA